MKDEIPNSASQWARRAFLKASAASVLGLTFSSLPTLAGPGRRKNFESLVPVDKKLSPAWIKSLFERGTPQILRGDELKYVGMPVGGIGAGQLYLGGDGKLWHWDIFNQFIFTGAEHYAKPMIPDAPLMQKFSLKLGDKIISLDRAGFSDVSFRGEYPIGVVNYADPNVPVAVKLEAFSPFIPLNTDDSSLPATIFQITLKNTSSEPLATTLTGELENGVCRHHRGLGGVLQNRFAQGSGVTTLLCSAHATLENSGKKTDSPPLEKLSDFGTMGLGLLGGADETSGDKDVPFSEKLIGALGKKLTLAPGESQTVTFVLAWNFPNLSIKDSFADCGRFYATKFSSAQAVVEYAANNFSRLEGQTKLWRDTWYDSTLPYWFLDRTFLNASILATSTAYRLANGRFYCWEGVGDCKGTCGHVYMYAQAIARLFPDLERDLRERTDFGLAQMPDGAIHFRGEFCTIAAVDSQSGYVLRALREHQMSADENFLRRVWPKVKLAMQWLIKKDANNDGLIESNQHNTLDTDWFGKVAWLSGLYLAALTAAAEMADEMGDAEFAAQCREISKAGQKNIVRDLFEDGYFINRINPKRLDAINSGTGCEIDQVFGQCWAFQVGLPRVFPQKETLSALKSLWKYNFTPDVGPYREHYKPGRWYAMPGEAGLLMCSFPRDDWDYDQSKGKGPDWAAGYFNECMNGFEHQVAGHMIWEGMVQEGLAIERTVHDRYGAAKRNPWNEIECGDHYGRSLASYGVYLAACGFEHHAPKMHIGFAPKISPENFKCAFTSAEGWGSYTQKIENGKLTAEISVRWGTLKLKTIALENKKVHLARVQLGGKIIPATFERTDSKTLLALKNVVTINAGGKIEITLA